MLVSFWEKVYNVSRPNCYSFQVACIWKLLSFALAFVIYKYIIQNRKSQYAFMLGYEIILPMSIYFPYFLVEYFDIRNTNLRGLLAGMVTVTILWTMEGRKYSFTMNN